MKLTAETARKGMRVRKIVRAGHNSRTWEGTTCSEVYSTTPNRPRHQLRIDVEKRPGVVETGVLLTLLEAIEEPQQAQEKQAA
jgi:hypothetical protein